MKKQPTDTKEDEQKTTPGGPPAPEVLQPKDEDTSAKDDGSSSSPSSASSVETHRPRLAIHRAPYRPSHKATFIGIGVVVAILAINAVVIAFVVQGQSQANAQGSQSDVTISPAVLDTLGVSRNAVGDLGTQLVVGPDSTFDGTVTISKDVSIGGELKLNGKLSVSDASLTSLQAGNTSLSKLNVNGEASANSLKLGQNLSVVGTSTLQGQVTIGQLLTVNNNAVIAGNLSVGGTISTASFRANSLTSNTTLTIGGHVISQGNPPSVAGGGALGSNGTVSISGNDAAGTVAVNVGVGASSGVLAQVTFRSQYSSTPHVVVTVVGHSANYYINRTSTGFTIVASSPLAAAGYAFDYIVVQ
jgi:carbonic anhydrase/acetyltransferase-like protein (isoleucine patch superfamily)